MPKTLDSLRGTDKPAGTAAGGFRLASFFIHFTNRMAATGRTFRRKLVRLGPLRPLLFDHTDDLRDHIARALYDHSIADTDVFPRDLIFIVQRCILHNDSSDGDGLELGDRCQSASAANLNIDILEDCLRLFCRKFVRDGSTRASRDKSESYLQREVIQFVNDSIDIIAKA